MPGSPLQLGPLQFRTRAATSNELPIAWDNPSPPSRLMCTALDRAGGPQRSRCRRLDAHHGVRNGERRRDSNKPGLTQKSLSWPQAVPLAQPPTSASLEFGGRSHYVNPAYPTHSHRTARQPPTSRCSEQARRRSTCVHLSLLTPPARTRQIDTCLSLIFIQR